MTNNVFANNLEIACKSGEGLSAAAFPDPCWSPPPPSAGPVVVPYPNTAKASDTANGSKTVYITGKPVMLRDKSFFSTSTGNEPATYAFAQGEKTATLKGKCYFTSWSMNVKIESYNVVRHSDDTTHNHASHPGNTGRWPFTDRRIQNKECKKELEREGVACGGLRPKRTDNRGRVVRPWFGSAYTETPGRVNWKRLNCIGLGVMPNSLDTKDLTRVTEKLQDKLSDIDAIDDAINSAANQAIDMLQGEITELVAKGVLKKGVGAAAGMTGIGLIVTAIAAADAVNDAFKLKGMYDDLTSMQNEAMRIKDQVTGIQDRLQTITDNIGTNPGVANDAMADLQRTMAVANPCLRAKKCQLISKNTADNGRSSIEGCCKGQTGHHLIPSSYFRGNPCPGVTNGTAPTVCAEGDTHRGTNGSHGALHTNLDTALGESESVSANGKVSYADAREAAIESHKRTFPFSLCSRRCLRAQLDKYYEDKCGRSDLDYRQMPGGLDARPGGTGI